MLGSRFASKNDRVLILNEEIRKISDVKIADHYQALEPEWDNNNSGGFIHLGATVNSLVAETWFNAINGNSEMPLILVPIIDLILEGESQGNQ